MKRSYLIFSLIICCCCCIFILFDRQHEITQQQLLEVALRLAGDNRPELEKVLSHYADDKEKHDAAEWLIANMVEHYNISDDNQRIDDLEHITADYLIENIDLSFAAWKERAMNREIPREGFYEYILAYRLKNEPISSWRKAYYDEFAPVLDSLYTGTDPLVACDSLCQHLMASWVWEYSLSMPTSSLSAMNLLKHRKGDCYAIAALVTYIMRSLGFPANIDYHIYSTETEQGHCWNTMLDSVGTVVPFNLGEMHPLQSYKFNRKGGKYYRQIFAFPLERFEYLRNQLLPTTLQVLHRMDVTTTYCKPNQFTIPCELIPKGEKVNTVYLCAFSPQGWVAIGQADDFNNRLATFSNVQPGSVLGVCYMRDYQLLPAAYPFRVDAASGETVICRPTSSIEKVHLTRKYPLATKMRSYIKRMRGGRFEGANRRDFSDAVILHQLGEEEYPTRVYNELTISCPQSFRYVRYVSDSKYRCDIAEMEWYNATHPSEKLTGAIMSLPGETDSSKDNSPENVVDGDPLTYYSGSLSPTWVGLDLGKPEQIGRIVYMPHNDDNFIRDGDEYKLYYFSADGWIPLGNRRGDKSGELTYEVPDHALFWLRDLTRGKEEQVFTIEEGGKQIFNFDRGRCDDVKE
jgi:hypothetical protein